MAKPGFGFSKYCHITIYVPWRHDLVEAVFEVTLDDLLELAAIASYSEQATLARAWTAGSKSLRRFSRVSKQKHFVSLHQS